MCNLSKAAQFIGARLRASDTSFRAFPSTARGKDGKLELKSIGTNSFILISNFRGLTIVENKTESLPFSD